MICKRLVENFTNNFNEWTNSVKTVKEIWNHMIWICFKVEKGAKTNILDADDTTVAMNAAFQGQPELSEWYIL